MAKEEKTELTQEELEKQQAEQLPDREVMTTIVPEHAVPPGADGIVAPEPQPLPVVE